MFAVRSRRASIRTTGTSAITASPTASARSRTASDRVDWSARLAADLGPDADGLLPPALPLPPLPRAAVEFARRSRDPGADLGELGALLETDAALTVALLRRVNAAGTGLRGEVRTAGHALALLGLRTVRPFVLAEAARLASAARPPKLLCAASFWAANLERACFARELAGVLGADPDAAFAGGMLQDLLLPALTDEATDRYVDFFAARDRAAADAAKPGGKADPPVPLAAWERRAFGVDHAAAAACAARGWGFPDDLTACLLYHHRGVRLLADPELRGTAACAVGLSSLIPDTLHQSPGGLNVLTELDRRWPPLDLPRLAAATAERLRTCGVDLTTHLHLEDRLARAGG